MGEHSHRTHPGEYPTLVSKWEGRRSVSIEHLFPPEGHLYLTDEEAEAVRQVALSGANVVLSPRLAMEWVCDWRNMRASLSAKGGRT